MRRDRGAPIGNFADFCIEATFDPLPFDTDCARAYGLVYAETARAGRKPLGGRAVDLLIAATALAADLPLYTANVEDFVTLEQLIDLEWVEPLHAS